MKTFKGLYETCVSPANLRLAVRNAKKSKRIKKTIKRYDFYRKWIKPGISFHEFRKRVGRHALFEPMNVYHQLLKAYS